MYVVIGRPFGDFALTLVLLIYWPLLTNLPDVDVYTLKVDITCVTVVVVVVVLEVLRVDPDEVSDFALLEVVRPADFLPLAGVCERKILQNNKYPVIDSFVLSFFLVSIFPIKIPTCIFKKKKN